MTYMCLKIYNLLAWRSSKTYHETIYRDDFDIICIILNACFGSDYVYKYLNTFPSRKIFRLHEIYHLGLILEDPND